MENFIIWINKNLSKLIIGIIVICFVISFINSLKVNVSKQENMINTAIYSNTGIEDIEIVREFINYCSTGNKEKAYNLLSESSKKNLYQNENKFEQLYYDKKWKNSKNIKITNLKDNIFKVEAQRIYEVQNITVEIEDICSVVLENGYKKININNFIKEEKLDKKISIDNIQISAIKRQEYLNYEVYQLFVENKAKDTIKIQNNIKILFDNNEQVQAFITENNEKYIKENTGDYVYFVLAKEGGNNLNINNIKINIYLNNEEIEFTLI